MRGEGITWQKIYGGSVLHAFPDWASSLHSNAKALCGKEGVMHRRPFILAKGTCKGCEKAASR